MTVMAGSDYQRFVSRRHPPERVDWPAGLHGCGGGRAGAHQHGAVDIGRDHQDAEENGPDDGALQTQVIRAARHSQARQVWVTSPGTPRGGNRRYPHAQRRLHSRLSERAYPDMSE